MSRKFSRKLNGHNKRATHLNRTHLHTVQKIVDRIYYLRHAAYYPHEFDLISGRNVRSTIMKVNVMPFFLFLCVLLLLLFRDFVCTFDLALICFRVVSFRFISFSIFIHYSIPLLLYQHIVSLPFSFVNRFCVIFVILFRFVSFHWISVCFIYFSLNFSQQVCVFKKKCVFFFINRKS